MSPLSHFEIICDMVGFLMESHMLYFISSKVSLEKHQPGEGYSMCHINYLDIF